MSITELKKCKEILKAMGDTELEKKVEVGSVVSLFIEEEGTLGKSLLTAVILEPKSERVENIEEIETTSPIGMEIIGREVDETFSYSVLNRNYEATILDLYSNVDEYNNELKNRKMR